ncbi:MAG: hypothetical protein PF442_02745 [Desulfobulbaceae bacterium]|nr:hypothetical protein [Desulfobulbaceae bacterium]
MKKMILSMALVLVTSSVVFAEEPPTATAKESNAGNITVGARITTLGVGPEISLGLSDYFSTRVAMHWGSFDIDGETDDVEYDLEFELISGLATIEWFPWAGGFHIDAGLLANGNNFSGEGKPTATGTFTFNDVTYDATEAGTVKAEVDYDSVAPYVGVGWDKPINNDGDITIFANLGVVFQGTPDVSITTSGTLANDPDFQADVAAERKEIEDDLDNYEMYPVIALGLTYRF